MYTLTKNVCSWGLLFHMSVIPPKDTSPWNFSDVMFKNSSLIIIGSYFTIIGIISVCRLNRANTAVFLLIDKQHSPHELIKWWLDIYQATTCSILRRNNICIKLQEWTQLMSTIKLACSDDFFSCCLLCHIVFLSVEARNFVLYLGHIKNILLFFLKITW